MNYTIGDWKVLTTENKLINKLTQELIHLPPKSMAVLIYFAQHQGEVISMEDLITEIWLGRIVGDHAVYRVINQLRKSLDPADKNAYIINIPKKGYQLIQVAQHQTQGIESTEANTNIRKPHSVKYIAAIALTSMMAVAFWLVMPLLLAPETPKYNQTTPLTSDIGNEVDPQFSADGKYMVYAKQVNKKEPFNIYLLDLLQDQEQQITSNDYAETKPVISDGAERLVFVRRDGEQCHVVLIEAPLSDKSNSKNLFTCDWQNLDLELSKEGKILYYTLATEPNNQHKIFSLVIDTGKIIQLTTIKTVNSQGDRVISLSPDNKKLAFLRDTDWKWSTLGVLDLENYEETLYLKTSGWLNALGWTSNNESIIFQDNNRSLSLFSPQFGLKKTITSSFTEDILSISHNSINNELAITFGSKDGGIMLKRNPMHDNVNHKLSSSVAVQSTEVDSFPSFANQSRQMAFMSKRTGRAQIWLKAGTGEEIRITNYPDKRIVRTIRWSPDDSSLLTETENSISYIDIKEKTQHMLIKENEYGSVGGATWTLDGDGIFFSSDVSGDSQIYHLNIQSKEVNQITETGGVMAFPSHEDGWVFLLKSHQDGLWRLNIQSGEEQLLIKEINSSLHRSIHIKPSGVYFVSTEGQIKFHNFDDSETVSLDIGMQLIVPILTVSNDEEFFAFPHIVNKETSIFLLTP